MVDLVNDIFSVAANAVSMIKAGVTSVMNAVKDGLSFIANAALLLIIGSIDTMINLVLQSIKSIVNVFSPNTIQENNGIFTLFDFAIGFSTDGYDIQISLFDVFRPEFTFETLSVSDVVDNLITSIVIQSIATIGTFGVQNFLVGLCKLQLQILLPNC